jgi:hypothetical protein
VIFKNLNEKNLWGVVLGFELLIYPFTRQALVRLPLESVSNPFCSDYFGDTALLFAQAGLDHHPSIL